MCAGRISPAHLNSWEIESVLGSKDIDKSFSLETKPIEVHANRLHDGK